MADLPPADDHRLRRDFLRTVSLTPAALWAAGSAVSRGETPPAAAALPQIKLGKYSLSRLICGSNPFNGGSHLSTFVNRAMVEYYTPEQVLKTMRRCQAVGINCWQSSMANLELYRRFTDEGGKMHFITIDAGNRESIAKLKAGGCIAIAHHGEVTDKRFKTGALDQIHDYLKQVRDAGLLVGVSTHMPAVVDAIESKGWDIDYYMTCVYQRHRSREELEAMLGGEAPLPVGEVYLAKDPARMYKAVQQTKRPCLAFKILAAGRLSDRRPWVEQAFREAFEAIKPTDGVIVGMYDRYSDQPADNAALVRRFAKA